jgi:broad specificity phosphatase PhoE
MHFHPSHEITFLRHAESTANRDQIVQGQSDYRLTDKGIRQSNALADYWKEEKVIFDLILASPLKRASQTAKIIAEKLSVTCHQDSLWMERSYGEAEGLSRLEMASQLSAFNNLSPYQRPFSKAESEWELFLRAARAVHNLIEQPPGSYLVVSHGAFLNAVIHSIMGISPTASARKVRFPLTNAGFSQFTFHESNRLWTVHQINGTCPIDQRSS